jgi:purine-nucleoside phosphorylase
MHLVDEAAASIKEALGPVPDILVVAGSGLGSFAGTLGNARRVAYGQLRHFPVSTVVGHAGELVVGECAGRPVVVMSGRKHLYEGVDPTVATLPLRALMRAGVRTVILSNAAGALNVRFDVGDLMLITDHINNMFRNPLIGPNLEAMGARFPDMSNAYDRGLLDVARAAALDAGVVLREGVYIGNMGPTYETQAEVQMLRQFGDAVGMSTVPETTVAVHAGARVLGISLISNSLVRRTDVVTTHEEVMEAGREAAATFNRLVTGVVKRLG